MDELINFLNTNDLLSTNYLLPPKNYEFIKEKIKNSPYFYEEGIDRIPIVKTILDNFSEVEREVLNYCEHGKMWDFPKMKINQTDYLYYNRWEVVSLSNLADEYFADISKKHENILEAKTKCPFIANTIKELEENCILHNAYISKVYPECVISPHIDRHRDLLRFQLCIQEDENCIMTVGKESRPWKKGKFLVFNHGGPHSHQVKHTGEKVRINFAFDLKIEYVMKFINQ